MIEVYCGDGKGKTTAAIGLAVRAVGHGVPVIFAQFLKNDTSGEITILKNMPEITVMHPSVFYGFIENTSEEEMAEIKRNYGEFLDEMEHTLCEKVGNLSKCRQTECADIEALVVLDEVLHACNFGLLDENLLFDFMGRHPHTEFVLTGRNPSENILSSADYVSEIQKVKHPYDIGIYARKGVEK